MIINTTNRFASYYEKFKDAATQLRAQDWFTDEWEVIVAYYGEGNHPNLGFTLQKKNWFNDPSGGIHFESWIGNADVKRSAVPIAMHFEPSYERSKIRRGKFHDYVLEHGKAIIDELEGYKLSPKSMQLLMNRIPFTDDTLVDMMVGEYNKLHKLGAIFDAAIEAVQEWGEENMLCNVGHLWSISNK